MDVEQRLRAELQRRVEDLPLVTGLADRAIGAGRRTRRRRAWGAVLTAGVAAAVVGVLAVLPRTDDGAAIPAAPLTGPPRVPLVQGGESTVLRRWVDGVDRSFTVAAGVAPVAEVPAGLLVRVSGATSTLAVLAGGSADPRTVLDGLEPGTTVAVSPDGSRATVMAGSGQRLLVEVAVPSGRVLRSVPIGPPLAELDETVLPNSYSGGAVLLTIGEADRQRVALWEAGDGAVIGTLDGYRFADGGTADGRAALQLRDDRTCSTEIAELRTGGGRWQLCREQFDGFSPDGRWLLAGSPVGDRLRVYDARSGKVRRSFDLPSTLRSAGWESAGTLLYSMVDPAGGSTLVVRCSVTTGRCGTAVALPGVEQIPSPLPHFGP